MLTRRDIELAYRHLNGEPVKDIAKAADLSPGAISKHTHKVVGELTGWYITDFPRLRRDNPSKFRRALAAVRKAFGSQ